MFLQRAFHPTSPIDAAAGAADEVVARDEDRQKIAPAVLTTRDLTVLFILILLFISNVNGVQFGGPGVFLVWIIGVCTCLIPCAYVAQWLARRFPGFGGHYLWTVRVLGTQWASIFAFSIWLAGVLAVVSTVQGCLIFLQYLVPTWFVTPNEQGLGILFALLVTATITCLPMRLLKRILFLLTALYLAAFLLIGLAGAWWLAAGHAAQVSLSVPHLLKMGNSSFAVYGLIILALFGMDVPFIMSAEVRGGSVAKRRSDRFVWWGTAFVSAAYLLGTFGVMVVVPAQQAGTMAANIQAVQIVFGNQAGTAVAWMLICGQVAITIAYLLTFSRLLVVMAHNRHLPASLLKLNRWGVPLRSIVVLAVIVGLTTIFSYIVIPTIFTTTVEPSELAAEIFYVLQAGSAILWILSTIEMCLLPFFLVLKQRKGKLLEQSVQVTRGQWALVLSMGIAGIVACLIGAWSTITSSWLPDSIPPHRWAMLVLIVPFVAIVVSWLCSEVPRMQAVISELRHTNEREKELHARLQEAYSEQEISVQQQQILLAEVDRLYREQAKAAITDAITSLPNHRAVISRFDEEIARLHRTQGTCAVLFLDIDHFKRFNDTWGHRCGDAVLREMAQRLKTTLRLEDFVGRYGGEEFAVLLVDADLDGAVHTAERLRLAISSHPYQWQEEKNSSAISLTITASIGVAVYRLHGTTREELIKQADAAMYQAKRCGRNRVCVANGEIQDDVVREVSHREDELSTLRALTAMAYAHDPETSNHAHRLPDLAEETAHRLQLSEEQCHLVRLGSLLHDIGKVAVPDTILHKAGKLTTEEWEIIRLHPEVGQHILAQAGGIFKVLASIVGAHHERWDGCGYPRQISQGDIPIEARILSVVDSYDAMTSQRVYREPKSPDEARAELLRCAGSQYDPEVVTAFLDVLQTSVTEEQDRREASIVRQ